MNRFDYFSKKAKAEGYPARSVYKLQEIDKKYQLIHPEDRVLDLGASPGSWLKYLSQKVGPRGRVLGVDLADLPMPLDANTSFLKKDVFEFQTWQKFEVIVSDLAPSTSGVAMVDVHRSLELAKRALTITQASLVEGGNFLVKILENAGVKEIAKTLKANFELVKLFRPQAVRKASREIYLIAKHYKPSNEPEAYRKKQIRWLGSLIELSLRPFIPRKETEFWVRQALGEIKTSNKSITALDIFSGSGCIGISLLKKIPLSVVHFAESEKNCLQQIKINLALNKLEEERFRIIESNIFSNLQAQYDYILANPPYIGKNGSEPVEPSVWEYEPLKALWAGKDGLYFIKKFLEAARNYLKPRGRIYLEFGFSQKEKIEKLLKEFHYSSFKFHRDQFGNWRWLDIDT